MKKLYKCKNIIKKAKNIVVLTGAGMSTDSGIPDFRSKRGVYTHSPEAMLSRSFFFEHPEQFYRFFQENIYHPDAKPNQGHDMLAKWEYEGKISQIITQNVDGLHQKAGSKNVIEYHGTAHRATCTNPKCRKRYAISDVFNQSEQVFWKCDCSTSTTKRYIKPDIVLYEETGEWMTRKGTAHIKKSLQTADVLLVLGTSLEVQPFSRLFQHKSEYADVIIINNTMTTVADDEKTHHLQGDITETLKMLNQ